MIEYTLSTTEFCYKCKAPMIRKKTNMGSEIYCPSFDCDNNSSRNWEKVNKK